MHAQPDAQINVTGGIREAGTGRFTAVLYSASPAPASSSREPDLKPLKRVAVQTSSAIAPGLSVPLHR